MEKLRKFKLKQWYPSLPQGWKDKEVIAEHSNMYNRYVLHLKDKRDSTVIWVELNEVENNPTHWSQCLFQTVDQVYIYEGDSFFEVNLNRKNIITELTAASYLHHNPSCYLFSTKESATKWIECFVPTLTEKEFEPELFIEKSFTKREIKVVLTNLPFYSFVGDSSSKFINIEDIERAFKLQEP